jgi:hypothetical protein
VLGLWPQLYKGGVMIDLRRSSRLATDEISEALGDRRHIERYYVRELRDHVLGRHSRHLLGVSRFYLLKRPQVAVDFEPD